MGVQAALRESFLEGRSVTGPASARLLVDGRPHINFYGSGYLALSEIPEIRSEVAAALGEGVPFTRQLPKVFGGVDSIFSATEETIARVCRTETSVYFASGYLIGMVLIACMQRSFTIVAIDERSHYSLFDAARATGLRIRPFRHQDPGALEELLKRDIKGGDLPLILTDGVFATTGAVAPLADYSAIVRRYDGELLVDDSHGFGLLGPDGRGTAMYHQAEHGVCFGATLSKAYCAHGAFVPCSFKTAEQLASRPIIRGSSAGSPLSAVAAKASLEYVSKHPELRLAVANNAEYLRVRLRALGLDVLDSPAPIVAFELASQGAMHSLQASALAEDIVVHHSKYVGAGPNGTIRCAIFRDHSNADIDALVDLISRYV